MGDERRYSNLEVDLKIDRVLLELRLGLTAIAVFVVSGVTLPIEFTAPAAILYGTGRWLKFRR